MVSAFTPQQEGGVQIHVVPVLVWVFSGHSASSLLHSFTVSLGVGVDVLCALRRTGDPYSMNSVFSQQQLGQPTP